MHPAAEVERLVYPVHHPERLHERFLGDVLGQESVPQLPAHEPEDRGDVTTVKLLEGVDVTVPIGADELHVRRLRGLLGGRLALYLSHECLRQATTAARVSILSGSFSAC